MKSNRPMQVFYWTAIFAISFFSFGISLFHQGIYWDDFTIIGVPAQDVMLNFLECGRPQLGYFHMLFRVFENSILPYKVFSFVLRFACSISIYFSLKKIDYFHWKTVFLIVLIYNILPINQVGSESIVLSQYHASLLLMFLAINIWLHIKNGPFLNPLRPVALVLLLASFTIEACASLFFAIAVVILVYESHRSFPQLIRQIKKNSDFLLIPFAYIVFQLIFLKPYGVCAGNNGMELSNIFLAYKSFAHVLLAPTFILPYWTLPQLNSIALFIPGLLATILIFLIRNQLLRFDENIIRRKQWWLFIIGVLFIVAATLPYAMVGKPPKFYGWFSRFQAHAGLGLSFLILFLINWMSYRARLLILLLFTFVFVSTNFGMRISFYRDYIKQEALTYLFSQNSTIEANYRFRINDSTTEFNALKRVYNFYDYTGLLKRAYGDEKRIAYNSDFEVKNINSVIGSNYPGLFNITDLPLPYSQFPEFIVEIETTRGFSLAESLDLLLKFDQAAETSFASKMLQLNVTGPRP